MVGIPANANVTLWEREVKMANELAMAGAGMGPQSMGDVYILGRDGGMEPGSHGAPLPPNSSAEGSELAGTRSHAAVPDPGDGPYVDKLGIAEGLYPGSMVVGRTAMAGPGMEALMAPATLYN